MIRGTSYTWQAPNLEVRGTFTNIDNTSLAPIVVAHGGGLFLEPVSNAREFSKGYTVRLFLGLRAERTSIAC